MAPVEGNPWHFHPGTYNQSPSYGSRGSNPYNRGNHWHGQESRSRRRDQRPGRRERAFEDFQEFMAWRTGAAASSAHDQGAWGHQAPPPAWWIAATAPQMQASAAWPSQGAPADQMQANAAWPSQGAPADSLQRLLAAAREAGITESQWTALQTAFSVGSP